MYPCTLQPFVFLIRSSHFISNILLKQRLWNTSNRSSCFLVLFKTLYHHITILSKLLHYKFYIFAQDLVLRFFFVSRRDLQTIVISIKVSLVFWRYPRYSCALVRGRSTTCDKFSYTSLNWLRLWKLSE